MLLNVIVAFEAFVILDGVIVSAGVYRDLATGKLRRSMNSIPAMNIKVERKKTDRMDVSVDAGL